MAAKCGCPGAFTLLFLDEVQDLNPVALRALGELTRRAMMMAGDGEQTIYSCRPPFRRRSLTGAAPPAAGPAAEAAETLPAEATDDAAPNDEEGQADGAVRPFPFREGPVPELYTAKSVEELQHLILEKIRVLIEELENIRDEQFSFRSTGKVRVSTLHSSKGRHHGSAFEK